MGLLQKVLSLRLNDKGQEVPDPTPVALPVGFKKPLSLEERMRMMIRSAVSMQAVEDGKESFEEANDFGADEDDDDKLYPDEDDHFAVNDPHLENAVEQEKRRLASLKRSGKAGEQPASKKPEKGRKSKDRPVSEEAEEADEE